uniref:G-protein coupled receptors family 1 profile domain-containing protein n=1 Tax=Callorhinchus milii TaxID=7868 RepID=A0A4W3GYS6_CALMI
MCFSPPLYVGVIDSLFSYRFENDTISEANYVLLFLPSSNVVSIVILSRGKCGLSKCITHYLVAMSTADLMVIIISMIFFRIIPSYVQNTFISITPVCRLLMVLAASTTATSVWLTVAFTFDRYVAICCQNLKAKYCSEKTSAAVIAVLSVFCFVENIPWAFVVESLYKRNNVPWGCKPKASYFTSLTWAVFDTRARNRLRKSIVLLFAVSISFILLWMMYVLYFLYWRISKIYSHTGSDDPLFIILHTGYMLQLLSSCTNTCIYAVTQTKFREELSKQVSENANLFIPSLGLEIEESSLQTD